MNGLAAGRARASAWRTLRACEAHDEPRISLAKIPHLPQPCVAWWLAPGAFCISSLLGQAKPNLPVLYKSANALCGLQAIDRIGHQRHANAARAGVVALRLASQKAARQHGDIVLGVQVAGESRV